ncbi:CLUMA_CG004273, isoform A [Clunio marinus]|uniref:CLUMA_CG004273, isoform A n=1 Tax=Clunio marinus TaxID=568069 RepID=A0A1J1HRG9_9DIPT|nr:CLUMA_CG004273, isoform A [Clunio marinus]
MQLEGLQIQMRIELSALRPNCDNTQRQNRSDDHNIQRPTELNIDTLSSYIFYVRDSPASDEIEQALHTTVRGTQQFYRTERKHACYNSYLIDVFINTPKG